MEATLHVWAARDCDPRALLRRWTNAFLSTLDATHPVSAAERAAAILRHRFTTRLDLDVLGVEVGASRSTLTSGFRRRYGISCGEYVIRLRLRWFVDRLRAPGSNAGRLAEQAGYHKYNTLFNALRARTGLTPSKTRRLAPEEVRDLFARQLAVGSTWADRI